MAFLHDFGMQGWLTDRTECEGVMRNNMFESLRKFNYLGVKTNDLLKSSINVGLVYHGPIKSVEYNLLQEVLVRKYGKKFLVVNVLKAADFFNLAQDDYLLSVTVDDSQGPNIDTPREWQGNDESWKAALSNVPLLF
jgi:hypothetical protein